MAKGVVLKVSDSEGNVLPDEFGPCGTRLDYYMLHPESDSGFIVHSRDQIDEVIYQDPMCVDVSLEQYQQAHANGWDVEWTENENL
jgi:hypothetical protein